MTVYLVIIAAILITLLMRSHRMSRAPESAFEEHPTLSLHQRLIRSIQGHPDRDRAAVNRALALGTSIVPTVLEELVISRDTESSRAVARIRTLEQLLIDFGLAVIPAMIDALQHPMIDAALRPSIYRIVSAQGEPGILVYLDQSRHLKNRPEDHLRFAQQLSHAGLQRFFRNIPAARMNNALSRLAPLFLESRALLSTISKDLDGPQLEAYLMWLKDWPNFCEPEDILRGLGSPHEGSKRAAAQASMGCFDLRIPPALASLLDGDLDMRRLAAMAFISQDSTASEAHLERCVQDTDPLVAAYGLMGLARTPMSRLKMDWLRAHPRMWSILRLKTNTPIYDLDIQPLIDALSYPGRASGPLAIHLLGLISPRRPVARERLIRLAEEGPDSEDRIWAVWALARVGDRTVPDLLIRTIRHVPVGQNDALLRDAAQHIGTDIISPLLRRFSTHSPARARAILSLIRSVEYGSWVQQLLHVLDDVRDPCIADALIDTLRLGGSEVHDHVVEFMQEQSPGIVLPALKYLSVHGRMSDIDVLLDAYFDTVSRRALILNIVECLGTDICSHIEARIAEGGGDDVLLPMEFRHAILQDLQHNSRNFAQGEH